MVLIYNKPQYKGTLQDEFASFQLVMYTLYLMCAPPVWVLKFVHVLPLNVCLYFQLLYHTVIKMRHVWKFLLHFIGILKALLPLCIHIFTVIDFNFVMHSHILFGVATQIFLGHSSCF